jgi:hypothetical protein
MSVLNGHLALFNHLVGAAEQHQRFLHPIVHVDERVGVKSAGQNLNL